MFLKLGLDAPLARAVADQGYTIPTPIQIQAIPALLEGRDVLAAAQTGTGKTAAFALPMLQLLSKQTSPIGPVGPVAYPGTDRRGGSRDARRKVRGLILTPTRELAAQVSQDLKIYGRHMPLRSCVIFGGVGFGPQVDALRRGIDIVVATPGRLLDHVNQRTLDLSGIEIVVLDEADRMLDMGFIHDIKKILAMLPTKRQSLLFSATFSDDIRRLAGSLLQSPVEIEVAARNTPTELVEQIVHWVDKDKKRALLSHLLKSASWGQTLVFARTKHGADRLAEQLGRDGHSVAAIHGDKSQGQRMKALEDFKRGRVKVLVATDVASRGIDIDALPHVVNYELPHVPEDYVHRIGRTGRAGNEGAAVSLVSADERDQLRDIQRLLGKTLNATEIDGFKPSQPIHVSMSRPSRPSSPRRPGAPSGRPHSPTAARGAHAPRGSHRSAGAAGPTSDSTAPAGPSHRPSPGRPARPAPRRDSRRGAW